MQNRFPGWPALLVAGCASLPSADPAPGPNPAPSPTPPRVLPAQWCGAHILVRAEVAGDPDRPLTMVLDTGSTHNLIDPESLARVGNVTGAVGETVHFARIHLGDVRLKNVPMWVQDLDHLSRAIGADVDGLLGYPTFRETVLTLDYPAREVRLTQSAAPMPDHDTVRPMKRGRRRPWIDVAIGDRSTTMLVDSGSSRGFSLSNRRARWKTEPVATGVLTGFRGLEPVEEGRLADDIRLGALLFETPAVRRIRDDGIPSLGSAALSRFIVTFDGPRGRVRLLPAEPSTTRVPPSPVRGFGLGWKPNANDLEIVSVVPGAAGDQAGLREGDRVVAIDGRAVSDPERCGPRLSANERVRLTVRRREDEFEVDLSPGILVP